MSELSEMQPRPVSDQADSPEPLSIDACTAYNCQPDALTFELLKQQQQIAMPAA